MVIRDPSHDHKEVMDMSDVLLRTMAIPARHRDVDRPGDRFLIECQAFEQEGS